MRCAHGSSVDEHRNGCILHLLRTLWVDQYLLSTNGDVSTAAFWLNDTPQTVLKRYHELRGETHTLNASDFNQQILGNGHKKGTSR
jgi:hypothetical protein